MAPTRNAKPTDRVQNSAKATATATKKQIPSKPTGVAKNTNKNEKKPKKLRLIAPECECDQNSAKATKKQARSKPTGGVSKDTTSNKKVKKLRLIAPERCRVCWACQSSHPGRTFRCLAKLNYLIREAQGELGPRGQGSNAVIRLMREKKTVLAAWIEEWQAERDSD